MNAFVQAASAPQEARTENGMKAFSKTGSAVLDLFSKIGTARGRNLNGELAAAMAEDADLTGRVLLWARDILEGAGERKTVRTLLAEYEKWDQDRALRIMKRLPDLGRADDLLFSFIKLRSEAFDLFASKLKAGDSLFFKWAPREKSTKKSTAIALRKHMGLTPAAYRKMLSAGTKVVETQMSEKDWKGINYSHVPSVAANRYKKAFAKHDPIGYSAYLAELTKPADARDPKVKINAKAIFPHDIVHNAMHGDNRTADAQWDALPNFVGDASIMPIVDTSGSMMEPLAGNVYALEVAISLGLYFSYKNTGPFKDVYMTFSDSSQFNVLKGTLTQRIAQMKGDSKWGGSTNIHAAFERILDTAVKNSVPQADMPNYLLILSDMEFNYCTRNDHSAFEMIKDKYVKAGYELPGIIFWNLTSRNDTTPVKKGDNGTVLISSFSPAIVKSILDAGKEDFEPYSMMIKAVSKDRYNF